MALAGLYFDCTNVSGGVTNFINGVGTHSVAVQDHLTAEGTVTLGQDLVRFADSDTFVSFTNDQIDFTAGGIKFLTFDEATSDNTTIWFNGTDQAFRSNFTNVSVPSIVFNESGLDCHIRFEGDTDPNLLYLDATNNFIGIGDSTPSFKLDVNGTFQATGAATFGSTGAFTGDVTVPDEAYGSGWNSSLEVPTKNAVYDKIETISGASSPITTTKNTADQSFTSDTLTNVTDMSFSVTSGVTYSFQFKILYTVGNVLGGVRFSVTTPTFTRYGSTVTLNSTTASSDTVQWLVASGDTGGSSLTTAAINTDYLAIIEGIIKPSANGTVQLQCSREAGSGIDVTVREGATGLLYDHG